MAEQKKRNYKVPNLSKVEPAHVGEFSNIPKGGYVCLIKQAEVTVSKNNNPILNLIVDIAEGEFKGVFSKSQYPPVYKQPLLNSARTEASSYLKGLLVDIERSNSGLRLCDKDTINLDTLINQFVGLIFREEEYPKKDGGIGIRVVPFCSKTVAQIHEGDFSVPPLKKYDGPARNSQSTGDGDFEYIQDDADDPFTR